MNHKLPLLAIVGRPNVGKSALFNRLAKKRLAIVDEMEGVTRDRLYAEVTQYDFSFKIVDTGGVDTKSDDPFQKEIQPQVTLAIEEADTIVMVVDGRVGILPADKDIAKSLLKSGKRVCLAVNKMDNPAQEALIHQFHSLGIKKVLGISAGHGIGVDELVEAAWEGFEPPEMPLDALKTTKIALVGRPNAGKSTLLNALIGDERAIVSPLAGTTRDSLEIPFTYQGEPYTLIDTAGIKRRNAEVNTVEKFAHIRTQRAIENAEIVLLLIDASQGVTEQEKKIAKAIEEAGKGCILLLNKWDLVKGFRMEHCLTGLKAAIPFVATLPTLFISAKNERNLDKIFPALLEVKKGLHTRLSTHQLNKFVEKAQQLNHPPAIKGKRLRIYYMTQVSVTPPRFILFVNQVALMTETYKKYLVNQLREHYSFQGVPLLLHLKGKNREGSRGQSKNRSLSEQAPQLLPPDTDHPEQDLLEDYLDLEEMEEESVVHLT